MENLHLFLNWNEHVGYSVTSYRKGSTCLTLEELEKDVKDGFAASIDLSEVSKEHASEELQEFLRHLADIDSLKD